MSAYNTWVSSGGMHPYRTPRDEKEKDFELRRKLLWYLDKIYFQEKIDEEEYKGSKALVYDGSDRDLTVVAAIIEAKEKENLFDELLREDPASRRAEYEEYAKKMQALYQKTRGSQIIVQDPTVSIGDPTSTSTLIPSGKSIIQKKKK